MILFKVLEEDKEFVEMWRENCRWGYVFDYGVLEVVIDLSGKCVDGKNYLNSVLVDWLMVGCLVVVVLD